jgi:hypothetical protein
MSAAAVKRAEDDLRQARLRHYETIMEARQAGHTLAQIGVALGVTRARVAQFIKWGEKTKKGARHG